MKAFETWYKLHLRTVVLPSIEFLIISLLIIVFYYFYMWLRMFLPPVVHKTVQVNTLMTYIVDEVNSKRPKYSVENHYYTMFGKSPFQMRFYILF